jgi:hypothetical protein
MKTSFLIHIDSLNILDKITDEQAGKLFKAIHHYHKHGVLPEMELLLEIAVTPFLNQFARDEEKYQRVVDRNRINGEKGGRPAKNQLDKPRKPSGLFGNPDKPKITQNNPEEPKKPDSDSDSDSDSDNKKEYITAGGVLFSKDFEKVWKEWEQFKKEKKQKLIPSTRDKQRAMLAKFDEATAIAMLEQSITNGWTGIFELKNPLPTATPTAPDGIKPYNYNEDLERQRREYNMQMQARLAKQAIA